MKKILIYGIGSLKNNGCEALVDSTINQINDCEEIVAATFDYEHDKNIKKEKINRYINHHKHDENLMTMEEKQELKEISKLPFDYYNWEIFYQKDVINEMKDAELCIHIGGDNYCYGVNEWIYTINRKAKELKIPTVLWSASLYDEIKDVDLIEDLNRYDLLMLREKISYNAIKKYVSPEKLMLVPDPAFSLPYKKIDINEWYKGRNIVGINLSPLTIKTEQQKKDVIGLIKYILENTKYSVALLPHVTVEEVNDLDILREIKDKFKKEKRVYLEETKYNCQEIKYIISKCKLVIAARTHASIAAYSTYVPTLVIGYSVKSRGIAEDLFGNYKDYVISAESITLENLIEGFNFINKNNTAIKNQLKSKIPSKIEEAKNMYNRMLEKLEENKNNNICPKDKCTGCSACANKCPKKAITMQENSEGFLEPVIDKTKCNNCGLCRKVCSNLNELTESTTKKCYAAKAKNKDVLLKSTSGGVFYYLAEEIIKNNGIVYGATINNFEVKHIRVDNINDIIKLQGSKYAQSKINNIYKDVLKDLKNDKKVLFTGTPCQIMALKLFLNKDYEDLTTLSVICHGVINDKLMKKRITEIEKTFDSKVKKVNYRSKKNGWEKSCIEYETERLNKTYEFTEEPLMNLFLTNHVLRKSCYDCPAKGTNNTADIILGDFWGIYHVNREMCDKYGTSAVIINTNKGKGLFNKVKNNFRLMECQYEDIAKYNASLVESVDKPAYREAIFYDIEDNTLDKINQSVNGINKNYDKLKEHDTLVSQELKNIQNSKRYKLINKIANLKNRIIRIRRKLVK